MTIQKTLTIVNKLGLHARAATQLVKLANQFDAKIILKKGDKEADGDSCDGVDETKQAIMGTIITTKTTSMQPASPSPQPGQ